MTFSWRLCGAMALLAIASSLRSTASAQKIPDAPSAASPADALPAESAPVTVFPHSNTSRFFAAGQTNIIFQADPAFHSPYQGVNSFINRGEYKVSLIGTLYLGMQIRKNPRTETDFLLDFESAGGRGLSEALGIAGFTNLDVVRNPNLGSKPYLARVQLRQTIGLTNKMVEADRGVFNLATLVPERRFEIRAGKMSLPDTLDINSIGTDSHLQFMNWTVDNNGAWDYAADTRGYTYGVVTEYDDKQWSARYVLALMPTVANGIDLDWALRRASGQNVEFESRLPFLRSKGGEERRSVVRLLGYANHAHMGLYRDAINAYLNGTDAVPDITAHERDSEVKYGFGLNAEQELSKDLRVFGRIGWNEGQHESFAYTEVDQTFETGGDFAGSRWHRPLDKIGLAFVTNAIKHDHQEYLKLGGHGFILGDGNLSYGREDILEGYYNLHAWRGFFYAFDTQFIDHPGYNTARGPVIVFSVRSHIDF
ncbi:carbohydrate porin [Granulicella aggregans]|uniref:carbohydrate porin n=1 Tax=Granulicella aggregans TaxID=474949 RepID=UPI0021E017B2|nr:carbohydrate porin [Granulicella aggregans]